MNKVSAVITVASLALDLGNTWTENNGNTNGQRVIKSAIQIGRVVAGIGVGAFAAAVTGPSILGVVVFAGITTAGGIAINQASQYLTNKAGIE